MHETNLSEVLLLKKKQNKTKVVKNNYKFETLTAKFNPSELG